MEALDLHSLNNTSPLLIFDLANNHNGSVSHGKFIITEVREALGDCSFQAAIKFQYRELPSFIHKQYQSRRDLKYVDRFLSTQLAWEDFIELKEFAKSLDLLTACTPFDEYSVQKIIEHEFDILKVASASFTDWSLLESVSNWLGPIVASTASADVSEIDRVVTFFKNRGKDFALMHCVASYPTSDDSLSLNRIARMKNRYSDIPIGYSTHENPNNLVAGQLALSAGAVILERHVGSPKGGQGLNAYSSEKSQLSSWIRSLENAVEMLGPVKPFTMKNDSELISLQGLRRYAYAKHDIPKGDSFGYKDVYFVIPGSENQYTANQFGKYSQFSAQTEILKDGPITEENSNLMVHDSKVFAIRDKVLSLLKISGLVVPKNSELEISHHYGIDSFERFGSCMITVVNRDYCKKFIFMQPGQVHPNMYHKIKDETFFLLFGDLILELDGIEIEMKEGDTVLIPPGAIHGFRTVKGAIIEEVSSTHAGVDSFYLDESINSNVNRKTIVHYWL